MKRVALLIASGIIFSAPASLAADAVVFEAQVSSDQVNYGEPLQLTIQVSSGDPSARPKYTAPDLPDFDILQFTPQQSTQWVIDPVRGQQVKHVEFYTYELRPKRKGTLRIGEAKLLVGGRTYVTRSIAIHVGGAGPAVAPQQPALPELHTPARSSGGEAFLDATASKTKLFVGEQVTVSWYLYKQSEVLKYRPIVEPKVEDFWVEDLYNATSLSAGTPVVLRGQEYTATALLKRALFPLHAGKLTVGAMESEVTTFTSAFYAGSGSIKKTSPIVLEVEPLPAGAPPGFESANVGRFQTTASIDRDRVNAGEPITLKVVITGQGNLRNLKVKKLVADGFKVYDPKIQEQLDPGEVVQGTKTLEYLLAPQQKGALAIPQVELVYFDPFEKKYETARSEKLKVTVVGDVTPATVGTAGTMENVLAPAVRNLRNTKSINSRIGATLYKQPYLVGILALPAALYIILVLVDRIRARLRRETPRARLRRARGRARRRFRVAEYHIKMNRPAPFFGELARVIGDHLEERLGVSVTGLTLAELGAFLLDRGFPADVVGEIASQLEACDFARFAPTAPGPGEMRAAVRTTREILSQIERVRIREEAAA